ncbi:MAG: hypothetical protein H6Q07_761 [Acidobacteria bacterium]|jgi:DNA-directed RNA polymerase specialized sigma24 family protein|nr:hypothetical protein [Acidobacteriota bacterium]
MLLRRALAQLPHRYRLIFLMKDIKGVGTPEARRMLRRTIDYDCQ